MFVSTSLDLKYVFKGTLLGKFKNNYKIHVPIPFYEKNVKLSFFVYLK